LLWVAVFAASLSLSACGGATTEPTGGTRTPGKRATRTDTPGVPISAEPMEFDVSGKRVGSAVLLEIVGVGRGVIEGQAFEDPTNWNIRCSHGGRPLQRVVNGSARVERAPVGPAYSDRWDVTVQYSVGFALPADVGSVDVDISAPGASRFAAPVRLELALR
jgi:hypothetical protein